MLDLMFSMHGRINRLHYWGGNLLVGFGGAMIFFALSMMAAGAGKGAGALFMLVLVLVIGVMSWASVAIQVKRFHDRGQSGYWSLLPFVASVPLWVTFFTGVATDAPFQAIAGQITTYVGLLSLINFGLFINLGCLGGTDGPNKYGNPPGSPSFPGAPTPEAPRGAAKAANEVFALAGANKAMEQAIAERSRAPAPAAASPAPRSATAAPAGFGRRVAR